MNLIVGIGIILVIYVVVLLISWISKDLDSEKFVSISFVFFIVPILILLTYAIPVSKRRLKKISEQGITHYTNEENLASIVSCGVIFPTIGRKAYSTGEKPCVFFFVGDKFNWWQKMLNKDTRKNKDFIQIKNFSNTEGHFRWRIFDNAIIYLNNADDGLNLSDVQFTSGKSSTK